MSLDLQAYEALLAQLLIGDNNLRQQADAAINECLKKPGREAFFHALITLVRRSNNPQVRSMCAVLMRKKLPNGEPVMFNKLSDELQNHIKSEILQAVMSEPEAAIRKQICDTICELAALCLFSAGGWPDLFPFLTQCAGSDSVVLKQSSLFIFGNLAEINSASLEPHLPLLLQIFAPSLSDANLGVRVEAAFASASLIIRLPEDHLRKPFQPCVPLFLPILAELLNEELWDQAQKLLTYIVDLVDNLDVKFTKPYFDAYINAMLTIGSSQETDEGVRKLALNLLVSITAKAPGMVRKSKRLIDQLFSFAMSMLLEVADEPNWDLTAEPIDAVWEDTCFDNGSDALDRLAAAIGYRKALPTALGLCDQFLQNQDWHYRMAALWCMSQIGETMPYDQVPEVMSQAVAFFGDPVSRVRHAAINCVGQLSRDFAPQVQGDLHAQLIPPLLQAFEDPSPRVQAHAAAALINFCEGCSADVVQPYLNNLLSKLFERLKNGHRNVQEQVITAIAMVADSAKEQFIQYYDEFAPILKHIIVHAVEKVDRFFRSRALECFTLIGVAVGAEKFGNDARELMELLVNYYRANQTQASPDDSFHTYTLQAWGRIATILGAEFAPYLPLVVPLTLDLANINPKLEFLDESEDDEEEEGADTSASSPSKKMSMKTEVLEEKASGCALLCSFASDMKELYFPYVQATADVLLPCITYTYSEEVRSYAVASTPPLMKSTVLAYKQGQTTLEYVQQFFARVVTEVINAFRIEDDISVLVTLVQSLTMILDEVHDVSSQCLGAENLTVVGGACLKLLLNSIERMKGRDSAKNEEDYDEETEEIISVENEQDSELNFHIATAINALVKTQKEAFLAVCPLVVPEIFTLIQSQHDEFCKIALYVLDDIMEYCGPQAAQYLPPFMPFVLQCTQNDSILVRQPACYGLGIFAKHVHPQVFGPFASDALQGLYAAATRADAREEGVDACTDNAISASAKILRYQTEHVDVNHWLPLWLNLLPLIEDHTEGPEVYSFLCQLIESQNQQILGENYCNLPKIFSVFGSVAGTEFADAPTFVRIVKILKTLMAGMPPEMTQQLLAQLDNEDRSDLEAMMNKYNS